MIKIALSFFAAATLLGCDSSSSPTPPPPAPPPTATTAPTTPPQLWTEHKSLEATVEVCSAQAAAALRALGFTDLVSQDHFTYANHGLNRAAVKCVGTSTGASFVYFAVAGPDSATVEKLRNEIAWKF